MSGWLRKLLCCAIFVHSLVNFGRQQGSGVSLRDAASSAPRVALVLHGSARSFLLPRVHASIKRNLIDALGARIDIFMRLTTQDNVHGRNMGAEGVFINQSHSTAAYLQTALKHVGPTQVAFFNLTDEHSQMAREFDSEEHEVFKHMTTGGTQCTSTDA
jgi:hypothetical protein